MAAAGLPTQPFGITQWMLPSGTPATIFLQYMVALDYVVRNSVFGPLTNATNDVNAAAAGVPINGLYRNGNAVQIRLT